MFLKSSSHELQWNAVTPQNVTIDAKCNINVKLTTFDAKCNINLKCNNF